MNLRKIKRTYYYLGTGLLIFFCEILLFSVYDKKFTKKIYDVSFLSFEKEVYKSIDKTVKKAVKTADLNNILQIYKNKEQEILYVDYDLNNSYELLETVTKSFDEAIKKSSVVLKVPVFITKNSSLISNFGPKITVKINYINSILTNLYTKITNYGLNNALVEAYIKIAVEGKIITPVSEDVLKVDYDLLISSKIINGRVPKLYGNYLSSESSIFDIPIE